MTERANNSAWFIAIEGIVVETAINDGIPQIKAKVGIIHDEYVHDEWITAMMAWVGADGYGPVNLPALGSEILIFGRLGQKHTLFALSRYNEEFHAPPEFADGSRGLKTDTAYKILADFMISIISQQTLLLQATNQADVKANVVRLLGGNSECVRAEPNKIGFLGAAAIARQTLPPTATDLGSCITLANAMRQLLIQFGFAQ